MYAIIDSELNVIEVSICNYKLEDKLVDRLTAEAHKDGRQAADEKMKEFEIDELNDLEIDRVDNCIDKAYQAAYDYKFNEISENFKIAKWDSKKGIWY